MKTAGWGIQIVAITFITVQSVIILIFLLLIGHFRVPKTLTFKMRLGAQPFLWKWVLFAWEWKMISISKAEHLPSIWNRGPGELGNGLITAAVDFGEKMRYFLHRHQLQRNNDAIGSYSGRKNLWLQRIIKTKDNFPKKNGWNHNPENRIPLVLIWCVS